VAFPKAQKFRIFGCQAEPDLDVTLDATATVDDFDGETDQA
jgi:hypothetical protein